MTLPDKKDDPAEEALEEEQKGDDSLLVLVALAGLGAFLYYVSKRPREAGGSVVPFTGNTSGIGGRVAAIGIAALDERRAKYGPLPPVNVNPGMILPNAKVEWGKPDGDGEKLH